MGDIEVSSSAYQAPLLPPCRVCSEKASGFHYGANTCEACKGFFRRSLQRKVQYQCPFDGECDILPGKRNVCASCRYKKCVDVGMAKTAIKTGRYTHEKKTKDIEEVKNLQLIQKYKRAGITPAILPKDLVKVKKAEVECMEVQVKSEQDHLLRESELDKIIKHVTAIHQQLTPHTPEFFSKLPEREAKFLERRKLQQDMFGTMKALPQEEYMQIYHSTGIDVDGRREMITHMIPCIEKAIKRFITFAKALPGFKELPIEDQIALIKASRFDTWFIACHQCFNTKLQLYHNPDGYPVHAEAMARINNMDFLNGLFRMVDRLKELELSVEELSLIKGVCILFRDRVELKNPEKVEICQMQVLDALQHQFARRKPEHKFILPKLMLILTDIRTLAHLNHKVEEKLASEWSELIEFPPLLVEMWSA